jgi:non-specific serine/threonine protein kinase/serine/threonine-protein kinase
MNERDPTELETATGLPPGNGNAAHGWIGPYRPLRRLGQGGMGEVWEAEQHEPVRRRVALKLIKWGMDTRSVVARFEVERQALAMMNHPNVAKVFDAGATDQGRPYFAMEYVQGVPITEHCDRHRLSTRDRLELFMQVCEGVQHAHQKGIIHRDIKPSNILVQLEGENRTPKIIDFGVAKATEHRLTERTLFTEFGQPIGTPEYMSPEQAEMTTEDIDTRTDVYSLGVLLYELLVGALPFDSQDVRKASFDEVRRRIREEEPSKPSSRLSTLGGEASKEVAKRRRVDPSSLKRLLRGDLDWITLKALEKDRMRRYSSPAELATDVRNHLDHRPVVAGAPSTAYRAAKFVRRHRIGVAIATLIFVLLAGFAVRERIQSNRISREAETARQVSEFLVDLFKVSDPGAARGNTVTAREILDQGAARIEEELRDQPLVQGRLMHTMGRVYRQLGLYDDALPLWEKALKSRRALLGDEHPETLESINGLGTLYRRMGRYDEAEPLNLEAVAASRRVLGEEHEGTLRAINALASLFSLQGRHDEAEPLFVSTLETRRRLLGNEHPDTRISMNNLAVAYKKMGRYEEAEPLYRESLEIRRRELGDDHPRTLFAMINLAILYKNQKRYEEAEKMYLEALEGYRRVLGEKHPETLRLLGNLGVLYNRQERHEEAERLLLETWETSRHALGENHPQTLNHMNNLGIVYQAQGRYDEAERMHMLALEGARRVLGAEHPQTLATENNLGLLYREQGLFEKAEQKWHETLEIRRRVLGPDHRDTHTSLYNLARVTALRSDRETAVGLLREALDNGWADNVIFDDPDMDSLRGDREFEAIIAEVKKRL